jgi:two-component system, cell cycle sensor histidine kinase and response regulator CckA
MQSKTILLVDDESQVRKLVKSVLARRPYRILEASDGVEALDLWRRLETPADLLLTDVVMPRMDGIELADKLWSSSPELAVLYMSGKCDANLLQRDIFKRGFGFIGKPFRIETLDRKVAERLQPACRAINF